MNRYQSRPIVKRKRSSPQELETLQNTLYLYARQNYPVTVRQLYYAMSVQGIVLKDEAGYDLVCRELVKMREAGTLPFHWIADNTRWQSRPVTYGGLEEMLAVTAQTYRRSLWLDSPVHVEVWLEKDALSGVLHRETERYDVPLMVTRGYTSLTFLNGSALALAAQEKPSYIYYFGDHDPSGLDIPVKVEAGLRRYAPKAEIHFERVAVNPEQIAAWNLPSRPTKKSDSRSKNFEGESVEVDAIPPLQLRSITRACIERHLDQRRLSELERQEAQEREQLLEIAQMMRGGTR
ncbi:hypothetical protein DKM44_13995 [Deinococcus irradiatisoli]|uniref:Uncharacterized protein n=1 Tax=Deinococcus irradiatisoli TaxID=2202254 RepID=A0A2Z3JGB8_9DEIO|nr:hypothetical protein [Deinococcus irradiatisoli]AWN24203.1 hypothetical protein DKM44_13995 [Deinococcus irradiatisoli]